MINIYVTYKADKEKLKEFYAALKEEKLMDACRGEAGNIRYDYYWPVEGEGELFLLETWKDKAAQEFHNAQDHFKRIGEIKTALGIETSAIIEDGSR